MELECDSCGESFDPEDEVESEFSLQDESGENICAWCNSEEG